MAEYDTVVPPEADAKQDKLEELGVTEPDREEDAPDEPPSDQEDPTSSSEDERSSGSDWLPPLIDCLDAGCTWPCAHHIHQNKKSIGFTWFPDSEQFLGTYYRTPKPRIPYEKKISMKDCQYCRIFFTIGQSDCHCGANAHNDRTLESGGCRCTSAYCRFRPNGQASHVYMKWTCGSAKYELGLATGKVVWSLYVLRPF